MKSTGWSKLLNFTQTTKLLQIFPNSSKNREGDLRLLWDKRSILDCCFWSIFVACVKQYSKCYWVLSNGRFITCLSLINFFSVLLTNALWLKILILLWNHLPLVLKEQLISYWARQIMRFILFHLKVWWLYWMWDIYRCLLFHFTLNCLTFNGEV